MMKCCLGLLTVELYFENSQSLKDRRKILNSLKERLKQRFNVSIAEADFEEKWQRGGLLISSAGANPTVVEDALKAVLRFIEEDPRVMAITPELRFYE
jgi:uncharacterized protein YlxP (DUF503 family)